MESPCGTERSDLDQSQPKANKRQYRGRSFPKPEKAWSSRPWPTTHSGKLSISGRLGYTFRAFVDGRQLEVTPSSAAGGAPCERPTPRVHLVKGKAPLRLPLRLWPDSGSQAPCCSPQPAKRTSIGPPEGVPRRFSTVTSCRRSMQAQNICVVCSGHVLVMPVCKGSTFINSVDAFRLMKRQKVLPTDATCLGNVVLRWRGSLRFKQWSELFLHQRTIAGLKDYNKMSDSAGRNAASPRYKITLFT